MLKNKVLYTLVILSVVVSMGGAQFQLAQAQRPAQIDPTAPDAPNAGPSFIQQLPNSAVSRIAEGRLGLLVRLSFAQSNADRYSRTTGDESAAGQHRRR